MCTLNNDKIIDMSKSKSKSFIPEENKSIKELFFKYW